MNHTSNGMNGNSRPHPPLPLMAKSLRGSRSRKEKVGPQSDPVTALPPIPRSEPPATAPKAPRRAKASERQPIPAEVADLLSFVQAYPVEVEASNPVKNGTSKSAGRAIPSAHGVPEPTHSSSAHSADATPKISIGSAPPSSVLHHSFREAYSESFREALETYREHVPPPVPDEPVAAIAPAPRKPWRSRFYTGPEEGLPEQVLQVIEPVDPAQVQAPAAPVASGPSLLVRLNEGVRVVGRSVVQSTARMAAIPLRGLRSAWSWYQGRRVMQTSSKRMRVAETISLGEKRFLAVVQVDDCQFLVGGGASSVAVLAQLGTLESARDMMNQRASGAQA